MKFNPFRLRRYHRAIDKRTARLMSIKIMKWEKLKEEAHNDYVINGGVDRLLKWIRFDHPRESINLSLITETLRR